MQVHPCGPCRYATPSFHPRGILLERIDRVGRFGRSGYPRWEPLPLAALAVEPAEPDRPHLEEFRFRIALLAVFFHEMEHLAFSEHQEQEVRRRSTEFYAASLKEFFSQELG